MTLSNEQLARIANGQAADAMFASLGGASDLIAQNDVALALAELETRLGVESVYQSREACELLDANRGPNPMGRGWMAVRRDFGYRD